MEITGAEIDAKEIINNVEDISVKIDEIIDSQITTQVVAVVGLDTIEDAQIILPKTGGVSAIAHCENFDMDAFICISGWSVTDIPFEDHGSYILFNVEHFTAYGGINVTNPVQPNLTVGRNWTINFTTNGTFDLNVTPINGTYYLSTPFNTTQKQSLKFLSLYCGNQLRNVAAKTDGGNQTTITTFYAANYSCNATSYFTSKVIYPGVHLLNFTFENSSMITTNHAVCPTTVLASNTQTSSVNSSGSCITFGADNIFFDCAGFSINDTTGAGTAFIVQNRANVTIRNCNIRNFSVGVSIDASTNVTIRSSNFSIISTAVNIISTTNFTKVHNNNITADVALSNFAAGSINARGNNISKNEINTTGEAIDIVSAFATHSQYYVFMNNITTGPDAGADGIKCSNIGCENSTILNNSVNVTAVSGEGISLKGFFNVIANNTIRRSHVAGSAALTTLSSGHNRFLNNFIQARGQTAGVTVSTSAANNTFYHNTIISENQSAVQVVFAGHNNTFTADRLNGTNAEEILLSQTIEDNTFKNVILSGSVNFTSLRLQSLFINVPLNPARDNNGTTNISQYLNLSLPILPTEPPFIDFNISYTNADIVGLNESSIRIYRFRANQSNWTVFENSTVDIASNQVRSGNITNFSIWAPFGLPQPPAAAAVVEVPPRGGGGPGVPVPVPPALPPAPAPPASVPGGIPPEEGGVSPPQPQLPQEVQEYIPSILAPKQNWADKIGVIKAVDKIKELFYAVAQKWTWCSIYFILIFAIGLYYGIQKISEQKSKLKKYFEKIANKLKCDVKTVMILFYTICCILFVTLMFTVYFLLGKFCTLGFILLILLLLLILVDYIRKIKRKKLTKEASISPGEATIKDAMNVATKNTAKDTMKVTIKDPITEELPPKLIESMKELDRTIRQLKR